MKDIPSMLVPLALAAALVSMLADDAFGEDRCRAECHERGPRVSYLKSIGGDCGSSSGSGWNYLRPVPSPAVCYQPAPVVRYVLVPIRCEPPRPFGWPAYANPLERRAYR